MAFRGQKKLGKSVTRDWTLAEVMSAVHFRGLADPSEAVNFNVTR